MSKISEEAARALTGRYKFSKGNTTVRCEPAEWEGAVDLWILCLHGNEIAINSVHGLEVTLAGWPTVTTRSRLNALPGVHVHQHKGEQYLNGEPWDGSWTTI